MPPSRQRKIPITLWGTSFLVLLLALMLLNGFNLKALDPSNSSWVLLFTALSILGFVLCVVVGILLLRNILKLFAEQRSRVLGSRLRTRMLVWAAMISILPVFFMFLFSYLLMNRSIDRWFSQPVTSLREDSSNLAAELAHYTTDNARSEADALALIFNDPRFRFPHRAGTDLEKEMRNREVTLEGGFAAVYRDGHQVASFNLPVSNGRPVEVKSWITGKPTDDEEAAAPDTASSDTPVEPAQDTPDAAILQAAQRSNDHIFALGPVEYALATAWVRQGGVVVVGLPMPAGMSATVARLHSGAESYWTIFRARRQIRTTYMFLLLMITGLTFFASTWLALQFSTQITRPVEALADAMDEIAAGHYTHRVDTAATKELGELGSSFNQMAEDLATSRALVEQSNLQISAANAALDERRREVETMLETIPNGVVMLDPEGRIVLANRAFSEMMDPGGQQPFIGLPIQTVFPAEVSQGLEKLMRRSHRMGSASREFELYAHKGILSVVANVALVEGEHGYSAVQPGAHQAHGYVVVLEDVTELLRAQKQMAWKEVARRVAHEIKNPLTPVSLSSERIHKHIGHLEAQLAEHAIESPSIEVIRKCSDIITSSVGTMRELVDQFSALAQFPSSRPRPADLNSIVENALAIFAGRLQNVTLKTKLAPDLPLVMADPESMKRALTNLIDNAAEAMQTSHLRELCLSTALLDDGTHVELTVADTGPGLPDEMRERLFMPYFSTKERGTGLGLTITAKIVQEHQGSIRAITNKPTGAVFIMELPVASMADMDDNDPVATNTTGNERS
ncbi:MAG: ATP-binding protein [Acidobacteriaceae bacterium]|jgi:nitrogen fixation/metabolism regulation signal transduction histidine kinase|nr:ATP-binding protein [Acidobacteriaceae bacterium]